MHCSWCNAAMNPTCPRTRTTPFFGAFSVSENGQIHTAMAQVIPVISTKKIPFIDPIELTSFN